MDLAVVEEGAPPPESAADPTESAADGGHDVALDLAIVIPRRAFIRAWAYNGLGLLAAADTALRGEVEALFDTAEATESAAVRVRIRRAWS